MKNLLSISVLTLVLSSCGSGGSSGGGGTVSNPNLTNPSLAFYNTMSDGVYVKQNDICINDPNGDHYKVVFVKGLNELSMIQQKYLDVDCLDMYLSIALTYTYLSANSVSDGSQATNLNLEDAQLTLNIAQDVSDYNLQMLFGGGFILNNAKSIINLAPSSGAQIPFQSGTVKSYNLKLVSPTVLFINGLQYNKQ